MNKAQIHIPGDKGRLTIHDIPDISQQMRKLAESGVSEEDIGVALINAIGEGETFTKKALRILLGRAPLNKSSEAGIAVKTHIEKILVPTAKNPELNIVLGILNQKIYNSEDIRRVMSGWTSEVLISIHNFIYESVRDRVNLNDTAKKYTEILKIIDSQLRHKDAQYTSTKDMPRKTFYGPGGLDINRKRVPSIHNVHHLSIKPSVPPYQSA